MVNKTQFYKTKVALAVVLSLGLAACGDSDGDAGSVSNSNSQVDAPENTVGDQSELSVTVSGVVVDTKNNGVAGVPVTLAGVTVNTDDYGSYVFEDVNVTNVAGVNNEGNEASDDISSTLTILVATTATHLGGTITITPEAQVNNTGGQGTVEAGAGGSTSSTVTNTTTDDNTGQTTTTTTVTSTDTTGTDPVTTETVTVVVTDGSTVISEETTTTSSVGDGGSATGGTNSDTTIQTFVSGYSYGAGVAVVPALSAHVTGYLTDCSDTSYDQVISGATVAADILSVNSSTVGDTATVYAGSTFTVAAPAISAVTDENGMFSLMLPADSALNLLAEGWGLDTGSIDSTTGAASAVLDGYADTSVIRTGVDTENDQVTQYLGTIQVCPYDTPNTNKPPQVTSVSDYYGVNVLVDGSDSDTVATTYYTHATDAAAAEDETDIDLVGNDQHYGVIKEGVVNNFTVNFSEPLVGLQEVDLVATLNKEAAPEGTTVVLSADMMSVLITFPTDLEPEDLVDFYMPEWQSYDADGTQVVSEGEDYIDLGLQLDDTNKVGNYVRVSFCIFSRPNHEDASITLLEQIIDADETEDASFAALAEYSSVFASNLDSTVGNLEQLNGQSETAARLDALAEAVLGNAATSQVDVDVNDARVTFEDKTGSVSITATTGTVTSPTSTAGVFEVTDTTDGATVTATAANIFGVVKSTSTISVYDEIAPTTVLQESYAITTAGAPKATETLVTTGGSAAVQFGDGGEVTGSEGAVQATVGNPIIYVQPRHLVGRNDSLSAAIRGDEFDALTADMDDRLATGETGTLDEVNGRPTYDATAYDAWDSISQDIGISISEDISIVTGSSLSSANITTDITSPTELNDTETNVDGTTITEVDLVQVTVADVVALANVDHGGTLSLSGVIADTSDAENVADAASNAQVVFEDAFPPMVTDARWDGTTFTVQFNEAIELPGDDAGDSDYLATTVSMQLVNPADATEFTTITLNGAETTTTTDGYFTWDAATNTLAVTHTTDADSWAGTATVEDEFFYDDDSVNDAGDEQHGLLVWDNILDTNGNRWTDFHSSDAVVVAGTSGVEAGDASLSTGTSSTNRWEVNAPQFLAVNELGQFNIAWAWSGVVDSDADTFDQDGIAQVTVTFSHPLDTDILDNLGNNDNIIQQGELLSLFSIATDGITFADLSDVAGNLALALSADNKTITIDLAEDAATGIIVGTTVISVGDTVLAGTIATAESDLTDETTISTLRLTATSN